MNMRPHIKFRNRLNSVVVERAVVQDNSESEKKRTRPLLGGGFF